ncbi:glycosyltransferase family protein [uncultured Polaribacter sp.]|uniref:glycosyltransferase family protein n=1 Tax=uncultured Polaribacter sp. TaxID=174711 RepID=UPI0026396873|nr:glycosyltransferase family protein [uncultured Polaribacter sp.]
MLKNKIIIAPLNWGLGHATRCVPIIKALIKNKFVPIIASDGNALLYLKKEFPTLETIELPSYNISYTKNLKLSLLLNSPFILKAIRNEKQIIAKFIAENKNVAGIISDNRFGAHSKQVPSVYISHQLNVLSGFTTFISSKIHQNIINKFNECWVPDNANSQFSGKLSTSKKIKNKKFIGVLSRFEKEEKQKKIAILVIISGVEPNRTYLENKLKETFKNDTRNIVFVLGKVEGLQKKWTHNNCTFYNYMLTQQLQDAINSAKLVICRSGYSSIMDLAILRKKTLFIPTKNQPEQEYLAAYLEQNSFAPFAALASFNVKKIDQVKNYKGLETQKTALNSNLFRLFQSK